MLSGLLRKFCVTISTQQIKKMSRQVQRGKGSQLEQYPRTFQQKVQLLNDPRTIQKLQIIEFGVKYQPAKKHVAFLLLASAIFFYINEQILPERVVDHYFAISNSSSLEHIAGFILAPLRYDSPFYFYLPILPAIHHLSKFVSNRTILALIGANTVINGIIGKILVDERVKKYEVWDQQRVSYGQGTALSLASMLWGALGPQGGFTNLKAKIFLKAIPGLGIVRSGIPIGYLCLFYFFLEGYLWYKDGKKSGQLILSSVIIGFIGGLLLKKFKPFK